MVEKIVENNVEIIDEGGIIDDTCTNIPLWLVSCELKIDNPDLSTHERKRLQNERKRIHNDLRKKFKCKQIWHSVKHSQWDVSYTSVWSVFSEKARKEIEKASVQWNKDGKIDGYYASVKILPTATNSVGREAIEWMAKKRERAHKHKNHCKSRRKAHAK